MKYGIAALALLVAAGAQAGERSSAPDTAYAYIISPAHGEIVDSEFLVRFGLSGMGIAPAGVEREGAGHHHLLIDTESLPPADQPMPASDKLVHFGKGQTEARVKLSPGEHTLRLVLGDHMHVPHQPVISSRPITITVRAAEEPAPAAPAGKLKGLFR